MRRALTAALLLTTSWGLMASCSGRKHARPLGFGATGGTEAGATGGDSGGGGLDSGLKDGPPDPDASGLCGNVVIPVVSEKPNLYFVVDRSGSMASPLAGSSENKYVNARIAIGDMLRAIGHRVQYGAAVFPLYSDCGQGKEVFPTQPGDPPSYAAEGKNGPVLLKLLKVLGNLTPQGGTPTASTLAALHSTITSLTGKTFVVLATDGAPNCNDQATCDVDKCMLNLEGATVGGYPCQAPVNCCDPTFVQDGQTMCVDDQPTINEVTTLLDAGVMTYVIGMPGSELYADVLDQLAVAGGTARPTKPYYYSVADADQLTQAVKQIGIGVAIKCTVDLDSAPPDPGLVNVYFDEKLLQYDPLDGWSWTGDKTVEIHGAACDQLKSGDVLQLQVVAGCPTSVK